MHTNNFFAILIASTILGLLIDGVRHHLFDERCFEEPWAKRENLNWDHVDDFAAYNPKISVDCVDDLRDVQATVNTDSCGPL